MVIRLISILLILFTLTACGRDRYELSYQPVNISLNPQNAYFLGEGELPRLIKTVNYDDDLKIFTDQNFAIVGEGFFTGPLKESKNLLKQGKSLGVTHILMTTKLAYSVSKRAYKFIENVEYVPVRTYREGTPVIEYDWAPNPISVPYEKEILIYTQHAAYLVKRK